MTRSPRPFCGVDFGTSNSTVGLFEAGRGRLAPLEGDRVVIPSAIFFNFEAGEVHFGRRAIDDYIEGVEGRLMRALKSVLGTALMRDKTRIRSRSVAFTDIIGLFLARLKHCAEAAAGTEIPSVVLGRPVHFVDGDESADREAEAQLAEAARAVGFQTIAFQFEPIAAALDYESRLERERLALIVDIGGGTADFSIVRVSPERARVADRRADILANVGAHIGGTDFDRLLSMAEVMPAFGYRTPTADGKRELPTSYYFDLASWHLINRLYTSKVQHQLREVRREAARPELVRRLISVLEHRQGHLLAAEVEAAKIALTQAPAAEIALAVDGERLAIPVGRAAFEAAIERATARITDTIRTALADSGLGRDAIQALFLTGGSTQIPFVRDSILAMFPAAEVVEGDMFGSVGLGLALDARARFG
jgi:hypothetical chaperone protein